MCCSCSSQFRERFVIPGNVLLLLVFPRGTRPAFLAAQLRSSAVKWPLAPCRSPAHRERHPADHLRRAGPAHPPGLRRSFSRPLERRCLFRRRSPHPLQPQHRSRYVKRLACGGSCPHAMLSPRQGMERCAITRSAGRRDCAWSELASSASPCCAPSAPPWATSTRASKCSLPTVSPPWLAAPAQPSPDLLLFRLQFCCSRRSTGRATMTATSRCGSR